jgi:hypothetical protein
MAAKRVVAIKQHDETDKYVLKRRIIQSKKLKDKHLIALGMCLAGRNRTIAMQHSAAEIIRQSVDAEFHACFDISNTDSRNIETQRTMYVNALMNLYDLKIRNSSAKATQYPTGRNCFIVFWTKGQTF